MRKFNFLISVILLFISSNAYTQTSFSPLNLAKKIFGKAKFVEIKKYSTDEYKGKPNGQSIPKDNSVSYLLLSETKDKAVVAMTILDKKGKGFDTYLHFTKEKIWKLSAVRSLAMTGMFERMKTGLEALNDKTIDNIIAASKKDSFAFGMFDSREDYNFKLGNCRLILASDNEIIAHFNKNKAEFERLRDTALKNLGDAGVDGEVTIDLGTNIKKDLHRIYINSVVNGGLDFGDCINFNIGGMVDNTVGYLYIADKKNVPEMNPSGIIMIREIGNGWYIYKTT